MLKKVLVLSVLAAFAIFTNGDPVALDASPRLYEDKILALIEDIRLRMCYNDPDGLPQLDPFLLPQQLDLDLDTDFGKIKGYIRNLKVDGLSTFVVDFLTFAITLKFNTSLSVPKLTLSGEYGLNANLGGFIQLNGEDKFYLELLGIHLGASAGFVYNKTMSLQNLKVSLKLEGAYSDIEKLTGDEEVDEFLNEVVSELLPKILDEYIPEDLFHSIETMVEDLVSDFMKDMTVSDLLALINGGGGNLLPPLDEEKACKTKKEGDDLLHPPSVQLLLDKIKHHN